jgi:hypothetical protein
MTLTDDKLQVPGGELFEEGKTECDGKPGIVQVLVDSEVVTEGMPDIRFADRQLLTIAFAPKGTELPPPPSAPNLDNLSDVEPTSQTPPVQTPPAEAPPAEAPSGDGDGGTERDADEE